MRQYCLMSGKVCSIAWSNSMNVSVLFHMKCEKVFAIVGSNCLKVWILFYFFWPNVFLLYALGFHAYIVWPLGWCWLKNNFVYIWFSWSFSLPDFRLKRAGQLNGWVPLVHLDWYHFKWKWNSSSTPSKRQIIEKVNVR